MKLPANKNELLEQVAILKNNPQVVMVVACVFFILDMGFLLPWQFTSVRRLSTEVSQLNTEIRNTKIDTKFSQTYKNQLSDLKNEIANLNKMVIAEENLPTVMESISKFADMCGVRIQEIRPVVESAVPEKGAGGVVGKDVFSRRKIFVSAKSGFHQLGRFMALLESNSVFLNVKNVEIHTDQQETLRQMVTMTLEVVIRKT